MKNVISVLPEWPAVVETFPSLRAVSADDWALARPDVRTFPAGAALFRREESAEYAVFLLSGTVRISAVTEDGREALSNRLEAGDICSMMVLSGLSDRDYPGTMVAETEVVALFVTRSVFLRWILAYEPIRSAVFGNILDGFIRLGGLLAGRMSRPLEARLAEALLKHAAAGGGEREDGGESRLFLRATHRELALELGSAREVVSRALGRMRKHGWIAARRGRIEIRDRNALSALIGDQVTENI